jgi:WD40 repeat protein
MGTYTDTPSPSQKPRVRQLARARVHPHVLRVRGYDAFVSYSHAADGMLAPALRDALQRFAKPRGQLRALRVFRDTTNLAASPGMWSEIEHALMRSRHFLLLASPEAARSSWVTREVAWWLEHRQPSTLLIVLTDGELVWDESAGDFDWERTTALPGVLRGVLAEEPRHVDMRWARTVEQLSLAHPTFVDAVADLAAPLHSRPKDELIGQDVREFRRSRIRVRAVIAALTTLTVAATGMATVAATQRSTAQREHQRAERRALEVESANLAAKAEDLADSKPALALLTDLEALRTAPTGQAQRTLLALLQQEPRRIGFLPANYAVLAMARSPDETTLALALGRGRVGLWDLWARRPLGVLVNPGGRGGTVVAFSPDSHTVATDAASGTVALWDARTGEPRKVLGRPGALQPAYALAFNADGRVLTAVLGPRSGAIKLAIEQWDVRTGSPLGPASRQPAVYGPFSGPNAVAFARDGHRLVVASEDEVLDTVDLRGGKTAKSRKLPLPRLETVAVSPDGRVVAAAGPEEGLAGGRRPRSGVVLVDLASGRPLGRPSWVDGTVLTLAFSRDGGTLAAGGSGGTIALWNVGRHAALGHPLLGHVGAVRALSFGRNDELASGGTDGTVILWDLARRAVLQQSLQPPAGATRDGLEVHTVAFDKRGRRLLVATDDRVMLWDYANRKFIGDFPRPDNPTFGRVTGAALSPDGTRLAVIYTSWSGSSIVAWDTAKRAVVKTISIGRTTPGAVAFSADSRRVAVAGLDEVMIWDLHQQDVAQSLALPDVKWLFNGPNPPLFTNLVFSPEGSRLAIGGWGVAVWGMGDPQRPVHARKPVWVSSVSFSPDGATLAAGGAEGAVHRFELSAFLHDWTALPTLTDQTHAVLAVALSSRGLLASLAEDGTVMLHSRSGQLVAVTRQGGHVGSGLAFSPDGGSLAVGTRDAVVLLDVSPDSWHRQACAVVGPLARFGAGDWERYRGLCPP